MKTNEHPQYDKARLLGINILEAASNLGLILHKSGVNYVAICPWHQDTHPSLVFYHGRDKNHCHCFSCGHHDTVIGLVMKVLNTDYLEACQWLSSQFGIPTLEGKKIRPAYRPIINIAATAEKSPEYSYIPMEMVDKMVTTENSLCKCLMKIFRTEAVEWVTEEYRIGCYAFNNLDDYTVFPCIDMEGRVWNLKIQHYESDAASPKFFHCDQTPYWLGKMWVKDKKLPADAVYNTKCLFGAHLLSKYPTQTVVLVESPKNAVVGALHAKELLWIATGNKNTVKREQLMPLEGRNVIVIPDRDAIELWQKEFAAMKDIANFIVRPFSQLTGRADDKHYDVADYIIEERLKTLRGVLIG